MQISSQVPFMPRQQLAEAADRLLAQYEREIEPLFGPPVPVEPIADFLLELGIEWLEIPDTDEAPILAYLHPGANTIRLNERRLAFFEEYPGTYEYTLAHEIGHYLLHLTGDDFSPAQPCVYRHRQQVTDRREWQAEQFASYLLLPERLLLPALEGLDLCHWPSLYRLRDRFRVSITALRIRLEGLGCLYVSGNGRLSPSPAAAAREGQQERQRLLGLGQWYSQLGQFDRAKGAYEQALALAREFDDRRAEALVSWQLGRLHLETDPARAVALLSVCVAYERETGHRDAAADAAYVEELKSRLSPDRPSPP